jgi:phospholipid/cholesterol/gamma-HCH transport system permease protein
MDNVKKILLSTYQWFKTKDWLVSKIKPRVENAIMIITIMVTSVFYLYKYRKYGKTIIKNTVYKQILFTGYDGLRVISFVAFLIGAVILIIGSGITQAVAATQIYPVLVKYVLVRELSALFTAIILIARSGTAIATEIGNMKINGEIDALTALGINIRHFIIAPRILGFVISIAGLTTYFCAVGILGGYLVALFQLNISFIKYLQLIFLEVSPYDIVVLGLKAISFGWIISTVSCYNGFLVRRSTTEVPIYSTKSVVTSLNLCFLTYAYLTALSYI